MAKLRNINSKLLRVGDKLATSDDCCCAYKCGGCCYSKDSEILLEWDLTLTGGSCGSQSEVGSATVTISSTGTTIRAVHSEVFGTCQCSNSPGPGTRDVEFTLTVTGQRNCSDGLWYMSASIVPTDPSEEGCAAYAAVNSTGEDGDNCCGFTEIELNTIINLSGKLSATVTSNNSCLDPVTERCRNGSWDDCDGECA